MALFDKNSPFILEYSDGGFGGRKTTVLTMGADPADDRLPRISLGSPGVAMDLVGDVTMNGEAIGGGGGSSLTITTEELGLTGAANDGVLRRWNDSGTGLDTVKSNNTPAQARRAIGVLNPAGDTFILFGTGAKAIINDGQGSSEEFSIGAPVFAADDHMTTSVPSGGDLIQQVGWTLISSDDPDYDLNTASVPIFVRLGTPSN